jgi:hypothetical protein
MKETPNAGSGAEAPRMRGVRMSAVRRLSGLETTGLP